MAYQSSGTFGSLHKWGKSMLYRLRTDFQLTIITLFGACAALAVLPFAVYRLLSGQIVVAVIEAAMVLSTSAAVVYAWRSGDTRRTGVYLAVFNTIGTMAVISVLGVASRDWMYVVLLANFFLVDRRLAAIFSAVALILLVMHGKAFESASQTISYLVTVSLVSLFAFIFASRTETQRLQLEQLATRDPLTGVDNRRAMEQELRIAVATHKRSQTAFGLVMLDLDHFKRVNDQYGHEAGDRVLIDLVELMRKSSRKVDRLFRFGGEEFVLLLPGTDVAGLQLVAANLRSRIAAELCGPGGQVTGSVGAAVLKPDEDWPSWLARADAAMYRAKESGRNCAEVDGVAAATA